MNLLVHPTKLYPPRYLAGSRRRQISSSDVIYPRRRLYQWLQACTSGKPIVIQAPDGFGKTTLVHSWYQSNQDDENFPKLAWLTLDEGDNDVARFLAGLVLALQQAHPGLGNSILAELEAPQQPDLSFLLNRLALEISAAQHSILCVLDDFQNLTAERIHRGLAYLLAHPAGNLQFLFITNKELPETLAGLQKENEWSVLDSEDLLLTPAETSELLQYTYKTQVNKNQADLLTSQTRGLPAAIALAGLALKNCAEPDLFWSELSEQPAPALEFLLDRALDKQVEAVREFLLFTSILQRLSGPLCDYVLRASPSGLQTPGRGQASLEHLAKSHFLTYSLDQERKWFQYHPLLAQILQERLKKGFSGSMDLIHLRASQWAELNNDPEAAIYHALEAGDEERASLLIELNALTWISYGQLTTTLNWLGRLSAGTVLLKPWLCLAEAWATAEGNWQQGTETLLAVIETAAKTMPPNAAQRARGHMAAIRLQLAYKGADYMHQEELARQALELLPPQDRTIRCHVATYLGLNLQRQGRLNMAAESFTEAVACANQGENQTSTVLSFCRLADLYLISGFLQKTLSLSEEALFIAQNHRVEKGFPLLPAGLAHLYAGIILYERDELEIAQSHFENSVSYFEAWGIPEYIASGQAFLAETYLARGNLGYAQQIANQAQTILDAKDFLDPVQAFAMEEDIKQASALLVVRPEFIRAKLASLYLNMGELEKASAWLEKYKYQASDTVTLDRIYVYLNVAHVLLAQRRDLDARRLIRQLISVCENTNAQYGLIQALTLQAYHMQMNNDYQSAIAILRRTLLLAEPENYIRIFLDGNKQLHVVLRRLSEGGPGSAYARAILNAIDRQSRRIVIKEVATSITTRPLTRPLPPAQQATRVTLTEREKEILRLLDSYLTEVEIAYRLSISYRTVDTLVRNICRKLGVRDSKQAITRARELKII